MNCPYCDSAHIHAERRGWNLITGFIGSGKIVVTCLDCGEKSKPGQKAEEVGESHLTRLLIWGLVIGLLFIFMMGMARC